MADIQVVHFLRVVGELADDFAHRVSYPLRAVGDFAQGGTPQVIPQLSLDPDGLQFRVLLVEGFQGGDVSLVGGAAEAEVPGDPLSIETDSIQGYQGGIPQPLVECEPAVRLLQREGVWQDRPDRPGVGPAQQPPLAVGEDAHANPAL